MSSARITPIQLYKNLRTDFEELLPTTARSVVDLNEVASRLESIDNLAVLVFSKDTQASKRFVMDLADKLEKEPKTTISSVEYRIDKELKFFNERAALYMDLEDLTKIRNYIKNRISYEKQLYNPLNIFSTVAIPEPVLDFNAMQLKYHKRTSAYDRFPDGFYATPDETKRVVLVYMPGKTSSLDQVHRLKDAVARDRRLSESEILRARSGDQIHGRRPRHARRKRRPHRRSRAFHDHRRDRRHACALAVFPGRARDGLRSSWLFSSALSGRSGFRTSSWAISMPTPHFWAASFSATASISASFFSRAISKSADAGETGARRNRNGDGEYGDFDVDRGAGGGPFLRSLDSDGLPRISAVRRHRSGRNGAVLDGVVHADAGASHGLRSLQAPRKTGRREPGHFFTTAIAWAVEKAPKAIWITALVFTLVSAASFARFSPNILETNLSKLRNKESLEHGSAYLSKYLDEIFQRYLAPIVVFRALARTRSRSPTFCARKRRNKATKASWPRCKRSTISSRRISLRKSKS